MHTILRVGLPAAIAFLLLAAPLTGASAVETTAVHITIQASDCPRDLQVCVVETLGQLGDIAPGQSVTITILNGLDSPITVRVTATHGFIWNPGIIMVEPEDTTGYDNGTRDDHETHAESGASESMPANGDDKVPGSPPVYEAEPVSDLGTVGPIGPGETGSVTVTIPGNATAWHIEFANGNEVVHVETMGFYHIFTIGDNPPGSPEPIGDDDTQGSPEGDDAVNVGRQTNTVGLLAVLAALAVALLVRRR